MPFNLTTFLASKIPFGLTLPGIIAFIWHVYNTYFKLPIIGFVKIKTPKSLEIEIINPTNTPVMIQSVIRVTAQPVIIKSSTVQDDGLDIRKIYDLNLNVPDTSKAADYQPASCITLPPYAREKYVATCVGNTTFPLLMNLYMAKIFVKIYGKYRVKKEKYIYLLEPKKNYNFVKLRWRWFRVKLSFKKNRPEVIQQILNEDEERKPF